MNAKQDLKNEIGAYVGEDEMKVFFDSLSPEQKSIQFLMNLVIAVVGGQIDENTAHMSLISIVHSDPPWEVFFNMARIATQSLDKEKEFMN